MKWIIGLLALALFPSAALAQTVGTASPYTFVVPLQFSSIPEANSVTVACTVSRLGIGATGGVATGNLVARGETRLAIAGGRYSGDVTVPTTWTMAGATGASYQCVYTLAGPQAGGGTFSATGALDYQRLTGRHITSAVEFAEGPIS